jgi:hypothetical protein
MGATAIRSGDEPFAEGLRERSIELCKEHKY